VSPRSIASPRYPYGPISLTARGVGCHVFEGPMLPL
jgi:hypothetical protein